MCKKAIYKMVRVQANRLVSHLDCNQFCDDMVYYNNKHDCLIIREALYAFLPCCYDIINKNSRSFPFERLEDFVKSLSYDLASMSLAKYSRELKDIYDKYIEFIKDLRNGMHCFDPKSNLRSVQWMVELGIFNIPFIDRCKMTTCLKSASQFLLFLSKLELDGNKEALEREAIVKWLDAENRNRAQDQIEENDPFYKKLYSYLAEIIGYWYNHHGNMTVDLNKCCNGSGSTNMGKMPCLIEANQPINKWLNAEVPPSISYLTKSMLCDRSLEEVNPFLTVSDVRFTSKFITVPKSCTARRAISTEPPGLQFIQQGIRKSMVEHRLNSRNKFNNAPGNFIFLEDNTYNRYAAQSGSITDSIATIDLSSASDSVRLRFVKEIYRKVPALLKWLLASRTSYIDIDGKVVEVSKFAGMGSGTCFNVETDGFSAITWLGSKFSKEDIIFRDLKDSIREELAHGDSPDILIFGDDITAPKSAINTVVWLLETLGFKVNHLKSFTSGYFKESCGGNYFHGIDITPVKWNVKYGTSRPIGNEAFTGLIGYANNAYRHQLPILREHCIQRLLTSGNRPAFTTNPDDTSRIYSTHATNFHLQYKKREVDIYGTKRSIERGWPKGVEFTRKALLYTRIKYSCTMPKLYDIDRYYDSIEDVSNSKAYCRLKKFNPREEDIAIFNYQKITIDSLIEYIRYLEWSCAGGEDLWDIKEIKHPNRIHRSYHLSTPNTLSYGPYKRETKLGYSYIEP